MNYALFEEGIQNPRTTYARYLLEKNGGKIISDDELKTASLLCNAAIEARVIGLDRPAMSITGSGAHGIIATMPLYGVCKIRGLSDETLYRATALSYLICMYIKEYSGKLSAFAAVVLRPAPEWPVHWFFLTVAMKMQWQERSTICPAVLRV